MAFCLVPEYGKCDSQRHKMALFDLCIETFVILLLKYATKWRGNEE